MADEQSTAGAAVDYGLNAPPLAGGRAEGDAQSPTAADAYGAALDGEVANDPALLAPLGAGVIEGDAENYFNEDAATLGDRVAAARQAAGLTQAGLATRLGVGAKVVSAWENDRSEPRANRLAMLAGLLNVSVTWLLTGRGEGVAPPDAGAEAAAPAGPRACAFALPVADLDAAKRFYGDVLGCRVLRADGDRQSFELFGHLLTAHRTAKAAPAPVLSGAESAPAPSLGVALGWDEWRALIDRLRAEGAAFLVEPTIRHVGAPMEHGAFAVADPSGNALGFMAYKDPEQLFG